MNNTQNSAFYNPKFYNIYIDESKQSADEIVPILVKLLQPNTVVDVGCGIGTWLQVFTECGVSEILGIDGDYIQKSQLLIDPSRFVAADLTKPLQVDGQFDLAISMEVGEHIEGKYADIFISSLVSLAPIILFSAAIPFQGGSNHVNEQWQEYWAARFREKGYTAIDVIRRNVWDNEKVAYYYAQNALLYVRNDCLEKIPSLRLEAARADLPFLSLVHPRKWMERNNPRNARLETVVSHLPYAIRNFLHRVLKRLKRK